MSRATRRPPWPDEDEANSLAARLNQLKIKSGVKNDTEFARLAGVARSSMSMYLNGKQTPRPLALHKLAKAVPGTDINWLLGKSSAGAALAPGLADQNIPLLVPEILDSPANFYLLVVSVASCKDYFRLREKPTLRAVLQWISGPYAIHSAIADAEFLITAPDGG